MVPQAPVSERAAARREGRILLGLNMVQNGAHSSGWRHAQADPHVANDFRAYARIVQRAEAAKMDFVFLADGAAVRIPHRSAEDLSYHGHIDRFEPLTLLSALAAVTDRIGLICTASTTYNEPYALARKYASLDHISEGRAGWNMVTGWSQDEALNFGHDSLMAHADRYAMAEEFYEVVTGLWDSFDADAFIADKESGRYFRPDALHVLGHKGTHYQVRGPLNLRRSPQGYPVIAQAGSSERGREFGARTADIIYTAQTDMEKAMAFRADLRARAVSLGRDPDQILVMPGIMAIVGETEAEAQEKLAHLKTLVPHSVGLQMIEGFCGDLSHLSPDDLVPLPLPPSNGVTSIRDAWQARLSAAPLTIRQMYQEMSISSGHCLMAGTAAQIADFMETWWQNGACDGWNLMTPWFPGAAEEVLDLLVPELQRRGLAQADYAEGTLRSRLGLRAVPDRSQRPA